MLPIHKEWPIHYSDLLCVQNNENNVGIITLWSKKEIYIKKIDPSLYNTIGQLYSREEGLSALVRNLLANKNITDLVVLGVDLNYSFQALKNLFENGVDENNEVIGSQNYAKIDDQIPQNAIEEVRNNVKLHDLRDYKDPNLINQYLKELQKKNPYGDFETFPLPEIKIPETFPSYKAGFRVGEDTVAKTWIEILKVINKFGELKKSQQGEDQREVINLVSVVDSEDPDNLEWSKYFNFSKEELDSYIPQITSVSKFDDLEYTYGERLMNHQDKIDQIQTLTEEISRQPWTRRAVASTWNVEIDNGSPKCPCLVTVQGLVQENKLYFTCYFRSNDMYDAWPRNAIALRKLQKNIAENVNLELGSLITISCSAHVYERNFNKVNEIIEDNQNNVKFKQDPFGTITITVDESQIIVFHLSPNGKKLDEFKCKSAKEAYEKISKEMKISDIKHAMDIGCELQKAEYAMKLGVEYRQDQDINLS